MSKTLRRAVRYEPTAIETDLAFVTWMAEVDATLEGQIGLSAYDLPDSAYRTFFEESLTPEEAVRQVLEENGLNLS